MQVPSMTAIAIDYYLQLVEAGCDKAGARDQAHKKMMLLREEMPREEYLIAYELITRISNQ